MTNSRSNPALPAWRGDVAIGDAVLAFRGDSADNRFHAHAAVQCVFSATGTEVIDTDEKSFRGPGWLIRSGVSHCLRPAAGLVLLLIEPQSRIAARLLKLADPSSIAPLPSVVADYCAAAASADEIVQGLSTLLEVNYPASDRRILAALAQLEVIRARDAAAVAARQAGISESHLRALCRAQFGVPFSKLVLWRKVRRACVLMRKGIALADVATEAGFADQAHLTRTLADVIGLTAGEASRVGQ